MTSLFWYKILFMTELLIAEGLFFFRLEKRNDFVIRAVIWIIVCYAAAILFPLNNAFSYTAWYASIMFFSLFAVTLVGFFNVFKISLKNALFCTVTAYTAQHLSYELVSLIFSFFGVALGQNAYGSEALSFSNLNFESFLFAFGYVDVFIFVYGVIYISLAKRMQKNSELHIKNYNMLLFSGLILLVDIVLNAVVVYIDTGHSQTYDTVTCIYNIISCILVFYIQMSMIAMKDIKKELEVVSEILRQSKAQYATTKENIDLINIKCHDLKHQISQFANRGAMDKETAEEIGNIIAIYDATVKTGNEVLDVILTEKSLVCQKNGIKLTCMTDCADLNFVKDGDLYALFGNLIDTAIEAVSHLTESEQKCIGLNVHTEKGFVTVTTENYFNGGLNYSPDGIPQTTKNDKDFHGFGFKSMKMVVEKYHGTMNIVTIDDIFRLNVLLPIKGKK